MKISVTWIKLQSVEIKCKNALVQMCACMMECVKTESRCSAQADVELMVAFLLQPSGLRGMGISTCLKCVF